MTLHAAHEMDIRRFFAGLRRRRHCFTRRVKPLSGSGRRLRWSGTEMLRAGLKFAGEMKQNSAKRLPHCLRAGAAGIDGGAIRGRIAARRPALFCLAASRRNLSTRNTGASPEQIMETGALVSECRPGFIAGYLPDFPRETGSFPALLAAASLWSRQPAMGSLVAKGFAGEQKRGFCRAGPSF